tara:strand:+ start:165 stop:1247 length:1083 start_codon:yes stop_codon:yes gene_type:complete
LVEWLAGNRIKGTSTERTAGTAEVPEVPAVAGGWKLLGRNSGSLPSVTSLANKKYYMILNDVQVNTSAPAVGIRLGNSSSDTGTNYSDRYCQNDSSDVTETSQTRVQWHGDATTLDQFSVGYISNLSGKEKLMMNRSVSQGGSGAGTAPSNRWEGVGKWANTSNPLDRIDWFNIGSGSWDSSSEMVVLGYDPDDTHTDNFWEELYSNELGSDNQEFSTGTITAKKYLWLQFYQQGHTGNSILRFNSDSGSNYARRHSINGASDANVTSQTGLVNVLTGGTADYHSFTNMFIINNSANEKLCTFQTTFNAAGGSGASNTPQRIEGVTKWANTSAQITSVQVTDNTGAGFDTGSILKIWGSN